MNLTVRDYNILRDIALFGGLTAEQIGRHHFGVAILYKWDESNPNSPPVPTPIVHSNCQRRMKLLKDNNLVKRMQQYVLLSLGKAPYLYTLTKFGATCLAEYLGCTIEETGYRERETRLRPNYVDHLLMTSDVGLSLRHSIAQQSDVALVTWHNETVIARRHTAHEIPVEYDDGSVEMRKLFPDAYFALCNVGRERKFNHLLEVDRGSETAESSDPNARSWARKIETYLAYFESTVPERLYGSTTGRVLTVTTTARRMARLLEVSRDIGAQSRFWFTNLEVLMQTRFESDGTKIDRVRRVSRPVYVARMPDMLHDPIWSLPHESNGELHCLDEPLRKDRS